MTATDELRLPNDTKELDTLLNERGQEHRVWPSGLVVWHDERTVYEYEPAKNHHSEYWGGILRMTLRHCTPEQAVEATLGETPTPPPPTPPKQPPYDELIESLRRDWDIEASWDGLRRIWYVGLTDEGVRKRDEREATLGRGTCEVEAENAKLRELAALNWEWAHSCCGNNCKMQTDGCGCGIDRECNYEREIW